LEFEEPSPSALRAATSPKGRGKLVHSSTWLPLWGSCHGLKPVTERAIQIPIVVIGFNKQETKINFQPNGENNLWRKE